MVTDANKKPVPGAEILLWDWVSRHMSGGTSDARGHYCVAAYATEKGSSTPPTYSISAVYKGGPGEPKGLQVESAQWPVQEPQHKVLKINLQIPYAVPSKSGK